LEINSVPSTGTEPAALEDPTKLGCQKKNLRRVHSNAGIHHHFDIFNLPE
jgi:hypothetical protein